MQTPRVQGLHTPRVRPDRKAVLRACWEQLMLRVQSLRPVERYIVKSISYRKHLADEGGYGERGSGGRGKEVWGWFAWTFGSSFCCRGGSRYGQ